MPRQYYFSETDVKKQRAVNSRVLGGKGTQLPRARRRRHPRASGGGVDFVMVTSVIPALTAIDGAAYTATFGSGTVRLLTLSAGAATDSGLDLTAYNMTMTDLRGSSGDPVIVAGLRVAEEIYLLPNDMRGLPGFDKTKTQLPGQDAADDFKLETIRYWLKRLEEYNQANDQSIGHDADAEPEWQDDDDTCPEA